MSTALGLAMQISANTAQLASAVADVNQKLDAMGQAGTRASKDLSTLKKIEIGKLALGGITAATKTLLSLGKSITGVATKFVSLAESVANELDNLKDLADRTGASVETLQGYGKAARESGTDIETFARGIERIQIAIGAATLDEDKRKKFTDLGLVFEDLKNQTPEQQFEAVADAVASIADDSVRTKVLRDIFGKGGLGLAPVLKEGPGYLKKVREEAEALGGVVNTKAVVAIENMKNRFADVSAVVRGLVGNVLGEIAGPVEQIAKNLLDVIKAAGPQQIAQNVAQGLLSFIKLAGNAFFELAKFIQAFVKKFGPVLGLDTSTDTEKRIKELRKEQIDRKFAYEVVGPLGAVRQTTTLGKSPEAVALEQQIQLLERRLAQEQNGNLLNTAQANFNAAVSTAQTELTARMRPATSEAAGVQDDQLKEQQKTNRLLEQQAAAPVEIVGGG